MPPKRKPKPDTTIDEATSSASSSSSSVPDSTADDSPLKKIKTNDQTSSQLSQSSQSSQSSVDDEDIPMCMYGAKCYRKNPDHFKEFRHPKPSQTSPPSTKTSTSTPAASVSIPTPVSSSSSSQSSTSSSSPSSAVNNYLGILQVILLKSKITADEKRLLRTFRKANNVSDDEHFALLKKLGWTEEEYDDGERKDEDIDLEEEKKLIENDEFSIIRVTKLDSKKSKERNAIFSKVSSIFYETMSQAQANFSISEIGIIVNPEHRKKYLTRKMQLGEKLKSGEVVEEISGFHGTSRDSIQKIAKTGFLHPDDLAKLKKETQKSSNKKGKAKKKFMEKPVEILDDGYYGRGIYFTLFSDYALWYSEERDSDQVMLCKLLPGRSFPCTQRMDGQGLKKGFDSHSSPKGNEVVLFSTDQILPRYIITFVSKEAEEREQES